MPENCEAATTLNLLPCLECASDSQLDILWLFLWAYFMYYDFPEDIDEVLAKGVEYQNVSDTDLKRIKVALFAEFLRFEPGEAVEALDDIKCLLCVEPKLIRAATLALICEFFADWEDFPD